jgi:hypothetical protein
MENTGSIIIYKLTGLSQIDRDKICRELLGRTVKTHKGRYTYHVKGLLDDIPHIHAGKGILIANKENEKILFDFLKNHKVEDIFIREIILTKNDVNKLKK